MWEEQADQQGPPTNYFWLKSCHCRYGLTISVPNVLLVKQVSFYQCLSVSVCPCQQTEKRLISNWCNMCHGEHKK